MNAPRPGRCTAAVPVSLHSFGDFAAFFEAHRFAAFANGRLFEWHIIFDTLKILNQLDCLDTLISPLPELLE
jgi:hypothetical protein